MIESVNLSLSNRCGGHCVFCPKTRGRRIQGDMPIDVAMIAVNEAFDNGVRVFSLGENGDALLNKNFLNIARYIKKKGNCFVRLYSNFQNFTPELSITVLKENLLNLVVCNIDGSDAESYEMMKGLDFQNAQDNLREFLRLRKEIPSPTNFILQVLTYHRYRQCILKHFGKVPECVTIERPDEYNEIFKQWQPLLIAGDGIFKLFVKGWAVRELCYRNPKDFNCPEISRIEKEAFIAPNGDWYACCWMENQNVVFGNIMNQSLQEIYNSENRKLFISQLKERKFDEIGFPCSSVEACQELREEAPLELKEKVVAKKPKVLVVSNISDFDKDSVASWFSFDYTPIEYMLSVYGFEEAMALPWDYLLLVDPKVKVPPNLVTEMIKYVPVVKVAISATFRCILVAREVHEKIGVPSVDKIEDAIRDAGYDIFIVHGIEWNKQE